MRLVAEVACKICGKDMILTSPDYICIKCRDKIKTDKFK